MRKKRDEQNIPFRRKILFAVMAFFFFVLLTTSFFGRNGIIEMSRVQKKHKGLSQEIEFLEEKKSNLEREIEELKNNPAAVELEARKSLRFVKPDEKVLIKRKD
jgi:cell division protein FtsB